MKRAFYGLVFLFAIAAAGGSSRSCALRVDRDEIESLDFGFWFHLDRAIINAAIFNWTDEQIRDNFYNTVLIPYTTPDVVFTLPDGVVVNGHEQFADFAVNATRLGLIAEYHVSGSIEVTCPNLLTYDTVKTDIDLTKTATTGTSLLFGRKYQRIQRSVNGLKFSNITLAVVSAIPFGAIPVPIFPIP